MILGDLLRRNALNHGDSPAVVCEGRECSHAELMDVVFRLGDGLRKMGLRKQDRIAILAQNSIEYLQLYGVCEEAGFIAVGLNYRLSDAEIAGILRDSAPAVIFHDAEYAGRVDNILQAAGRFMPRFSIGGDAADALTFDKLVSKSLPDAHAPRATESDTVYIFYTSGTTGLPKGAMLPNGGQAAQNQIYAEVVGARPSDRMLIVMPLFHCGGTILHWMYTAAGGAIVLHRAFDPARIIASLSEDGVTAAHLAPVMIHQIVDLLDATPRPFPLLHTLHYASAPMSVALLRRAIGHFGLVFVQSYGMTENGAGSFLDKHQHVLEGPAIEVERLASAGQPFKGTDIRIVSEAGAPCSVREIGEIQMRAPGLMSGYWNNHVASLDALRDGWMQTGDIGFLDEDGFLFIVDRKKDMIISGGENIYSREVEEALACHPAISEVAVVGVPDAKWGEAVKAFVVLRPAALASEAELVEHVRSRIASYKKPKSIEFVGALPRLSSTNKIDKKTLRAPYWAPASRHVA